IYALTRRQVTPVTVIAFLTILGYSLYDPRAPMRGRSTAPSICAQCEQLWWTSSSKRGQGL
ncbi:MAG: hypothetical protein H5T86_12040, partial [Armatimonadetes bacterium]|nr:hypothetical protein [Armatimonadota bacterium]